MYSEGPAGEEPSASPLIELGANLRLDINVFGSRIESRTNCQPDHPPPILPAVVGSLHRTRRPGASIALYAAALVFDLLIWFLNSSIICMTKRVDANHRSASSGV